MDNDEMLTEFCIPKSELNAEMMVGDYGKLAMTVEVIGIMADHIMFRKHKKAVIEGDFKPESAKLMRERLINKEEDKTDSSGSSEE